MTVNVSVVIPTLNAAAFLAGTLATVADAAGEVVVSDGGSTDGTQSLAASLSARVVSGARGRGGQLAAGIARATGDWLLLLHADTRLDAGWGGEARRLAAAGTAQAGYFRFVLDSADPRARRLERRVAWRCRRFGLPYGDQGLLLSRTLLGTVGGIRSLPLMEDVDLVRRIGRGRLVALDAAAITSAARWERDGWRRRSARNLGCLMLYYAGVPPYLIAKLYA